MTIALALGSIGKDPNRSLFGLYETVVAKDPHAQLAGRGGWRIIMPKKIEVSGLCNYRLERLLESNDGLETFTDVIMWAIDAAIEVGWTPSDAHLLGTDMFFEED